jgi:hypothetical protein
MEREQGGRVFDSEAEGRPVQMGNCFGCLQPIYSYQEWVTLNSPRLHHPHERSPHLFHNTELCLPRDGTPVVPFETQKAQVLLRQVLAWGIWDKPEMGLD